MNAVEPGLRCAAAARDREDPIVATAPPATRWLLLEHPGPWPVDAVAGCGIEPELLARLIRTSTEHSIRILLIRRPGRAARTGVRRWVLASLDGATIDGTWVGDHELEPAIEAMTTPPAPATTPMEPMILVCTHGVHDVCCALRGRPVAAALAARWPDQVWECSHVGGDRFAPNVVLLPGGFYYGNLEVASAERTVEQHLAGTVGTEFLRGMARFPPAAQAAVVSAYAEFAPLAPHDVSVRSLARVRPQTDHLSHFTVHLEVAGMADLVRAEVVGLRRRPAQLTCRAARESPATEYRVLSLTPGGSPRG